MGVALGDAMPIEWLESCTTMMLLGDAGDPPQQPGAITPLGLMGTKVLQTMRDMIPIVVVILFFQLIVLRRPIANLGKVIWGFVFVLLGLAFFLVGLELALFPLGKTMADQLTSAEFLQLNQQQPALEVMAKLPWYKYHWTYLFAFLIAFSTTIAEPALIAVALKAQEVSGGSVQAWGLRIAVAIGAGIGVSLGALRIILGVPLPYFIFAGYLIVIVQTYFAPKSIVPLAYDSGGVTTSTVTVPVVAALGWGLTNNIPGRDPLIDGFGMIALAVLFPMITVMTYAQLSQWYFNYKSRTTRRDMKPNEPTQS